jgi:putative DNA primase/helicase
MGKRNLITSKEEFVRNAVEFFETLFGENHASTCGDTEIRVFPKGGIPEQRFCEKTQDAAFLAYDLCNSGIDTYFGVNPRVGKGGKKENVHYVTAFHAEVDYGTDGHKKMEKYETHDQVLEAIRDFNPPPTLVNHSGGGFHCYWVLENPASVSEHGIERLESINKALLTELGGDKGTHNLDRVLRVPGTFNFKLENNPREVTRVITDGPKYQVSDFDQLLSKETVPDTKKERESNPESEGTKPPWDQNLDSLHLSDQIKNLILTGKSKTYPSRSEADQAVVTALISKGLGKSDIKKIFESYPVGRKYQQHQAPDKYLDHCIESAKKFMDLSEEERVDPLFISGSIQKNNGTHSLAALNFEEFMSKKHKLKYLEDENAYFMYTGKCYEHCRESFLNHICQTELGKYRGLFKSSSLKEFCHFCAGGNLIRGERARKDRVKFLSLQNGLFNLETGELIPHTPDVFTTNLLPYDFDPNAECPRFLQYLDEVFNSDQDLITFVQEAVGYTFHKAIPMPAIFFLIGGGSNGKSVFINLLTDLIGEHNACSISINALSKEYYILSLFDKMVNVSGETPQRKQVNTDLVKAAVAGDWVTGREPYKQPVKFKPFAKHFLAMNEIPVIDDMTHGMMRRLYFISFPRTFKMEEMDVDLPRKLKKELSGIFNWALEGYKRLRGRRFRFTEPVSMKQSKSEYRNQRNSASAFMSQCIEKDPSNEGMKFSELYHAYENFSESEGFEKLFPKRVLRGMLEKEGYEVGNSSRHNNQLFVSGVKVTWEEME